MVNIVSDKDSFFQTSLVILWRMYPTIKSRHSRFFRRCKERREVPRFEIGIPDFIPGSSNMSTVDEFKMVAV